MVKFKHYRTGRVIELADKDPRVVEYDRGKRWQRIDDKPAGRPVRDNPQA